MATLTVGPFGTYTTIAAAVAAARDGDVVQVQAGTYTNDFVHVTSKITIEGVGGTVHMVATVPCPDGKAIMTTDADATIKNFDFSGAKVPDENGAGIRYEGGNLTIDNCSFHDNQNGLLSSPIQDGVLTIDNSTFNHNGAGNGSTHNIYVGVIDTVKITNSTFTAAVVGHEIKSRAVNTIIENCTIADGPTSDSSYSIDLPNGGNALIQNNTIEKGPNAENQTIIHYGGEAIAFAGSQLTIADNTITNDLTQHSPTLLSNQTLINATITGNTLLGVPLANYASGPATLTNNRTASGPLPDSTMTDIGSTGNAVYITDDADHNVVLPSSGMAVQGKAGHLTATGWSHEVVIGGAGGLTWNGQDGADTIYTVAGATDTLNLGNAGSQVQSAGTDMIYGGIGNNAIGISGSATVTGGTGNNNIQVTGSAVIRDHGSDQISIGANGTADIVSDGYVSLATNGGTFSLSHTPSGAPVADTVTVRGGAANLLTLDQGLSLNFAGGNKGANITLGTGNHQVVSRAPDTIHAGSGSDTVILSGSAQVYQGAGTLNVYGRGITGMATVHGGAGTMLLDGDSGHITYQAEGGAATLNDRLAGTVVVGGESLLTVNAMAGMLTVQGGSGGIVFNDSAGNHIITTAAGAHDTINLSGGSAVTSNGTDQIDVGPSNASVTANGAATVRGGTGNSAFVLNGHDTLLTRSAGIDRVTVGGSAEASLSSISAYDLVEVTGGQLNYSAVDNSSGTLMATTVLVAGHAEFSRADGSIAHVTTEAGAATSVNTNTAARVESSGADTIHAGSGFLTASTRGQAQLTFGSGGGSEVNSGAVTVTGGSGAVNVESWGGSVNFVGSTGSANLTIWAGTGTVMAGKGNITLGGGAAVLFKAGSGSAVVNSGNGDTIMAGAGAMTVNAGNGREILEFQAGRSHGTTLVNNFDSAVDRIQLDGYAPGSARASSYAGGTMLTLSDGTKVEFAGVSKLPGFA